MTSVMDPNVTKFNPETARVYHFRYMREYRAICALWGLLTIIWCILNLVSFIQPQWIGDSPQSPGYGHLGVYANCYPDHALGEYVCDGSPFSWDSILNNSFKATSFFVGVSALLMLITVAALLFFFCFKKTLVFYLCGIMEIISALFMFLACVIYPSGWNQAEVRTICGDTAGEYRLGECGIRWAYILAILGIFDAAFLAILAFLLATKRAKLEMYSTTGTVTKSELNGYSGDTLSKHSMPIQPVVAVPDSHYGSRRDFTL
ncbi:LHFPL tetraspan subfamily member 5 protein-like [Ylistrum balloti]|uniref:LHFPL tetraspan subfamily member 5 protein-like n=1 Tax=Ylistrum balloti TaxID=509963 RepID=UPI0029058205|nr:LHFPL tetraspan subfamily member 5 protein-like [Ylistrum balloti]